MHAIKYNIKINFHLYHKNIGYTYLLLRCTINVYVCIFWKKKKKCSEKFFTVAYCQNYGSMKFLLVSHVLYPFKMPCALDIWCMRWSLLHSNLGLLRYKFKAALAYKILYPTWKLFTCIHVHSKQMIGKGIECHWMLLFCITIYK